MIFTSDNKFLRIKRYWKEKKTLKDREEVKQIIQTSAHHSYLVFPSGNLISTDLQDLYC